MLTCSGHRISCFRWCGVRSGRHASGREGKVADEKDNTFGKAARLVITYLHYQM